MPSNMKFEVIQLDHLVQIPGTFESPEHFPDYIAVAAEECSGSYSQRSSSPETYISTDDASYDFLDDLPHVNEDVANEIVNDIVYEDPSFGSVLFDGDISDILNVEADSSDGNEVLSSESFENLENDTLLVADTSTRRKQRIILKKSEPFEEGLSSYCPNDLAQPQKSSSLKRPIGNSDGDKYVPVSKKLIRTTPNHFPVETKYVSSRLPLVKNEINLDSLQQSLVNDKQSCIRQRKRGLTQDERKERKKQSNRNASYRYRQRKKEEIDSFHEESNHVITCFENEKEAYKEVVEEFIRCIKRAQLVSDARGERRKELMLKT